jgi:hypothetical protein
MDELDAALLIALQAVAERDGVRWSFTGLIGQRVRLQMYSVSSDWEFDVSRLVIDLHLVPDPGGRPWADFEGSAEEVRRDVPRLGS